MPTTADRNVNVTTSSKMTLDHSAAEPYAVMKYSMLVKTAILLIRTIVEVIASVLVLFSILIVLLWDVNRHAVTKLSI